MIIGVCGLGYTGSGAVLDFLKEFEENQVIDEVEFSLAYFPDGLEDLEYHLVKNPSRYFSSDVAIKRFRNYYKSMCSPRSWYKNATNNQFFTLSEGYIESLIQARWQGIWAFDWVEANWWQKNIKYRLIGRLQHISDKISKRYWSFLPEREMCLSIRPENFYELTRKYIKDIFLAAGLNDEKNIVLDQPFSGDNPEKSFVFFENPRAIVVDRDPRDLYLLAKKVILSKGRFMPSDDVETFVKYYKLLRASHDSHISQGILKIRFEDLIYEYDKTTRKIIEFIGLKTHNYPKKYFDPDISRNNTQLFRKYTRFDNEISYIEHELKEYLFPFEKYQVYTEHGKSF